MKHYESECLICGKKTQIAFSTEPYPKYGELFRHFCSTCEADTDHTRTLTKKTASQIRKNQAEHRLREEIITLCKAKDFSCRFLHQSVIVTTDLSDWCFDYHQSKITLYHESTTKINFATGNYAKSHVQFRNRKISISEVIEYIASHEIWRKESTSLK